MTTLYVRDGDNFREAAAQDVFDRANALLSQRYRTGAPVMSSPQRTREFLRLKLGALDQAPTTRPPFIASPSRISAA